MGDRCVQPLERPVYIERTGTLLEDLHTELKRLENSLNHSCLLLNQLNNNCGKCSLDCHYVHLGTLTDDRFRTGDTPTNRNQF